MLSNSTRIHPSHLLVAPSSTRLCYAPSSRPILLSQRTGFTPKTSLGLSLSSHYQNPETFPASILKKIINSTQVRKSPTETKQTDLNRRATTTIETGEEKKEEDVELRWDFIKKVYNSLAAQFLFTSAVETGEEKKEEELEYRWGFIKKVYNNLAAQFLFTGVVYAVCKIYSPAFTGHSTLLLDVGRFYTFLDPHWRHMNSFILGLFGVGATVLVGADLANNLSGKIILAAVIATSAMVAMATKLALWTSEKKRKALTYIIPLFGFLFLAQITVGSIQISSLGPISSAIVFGIHPILTSSSIFNQTEKLLKGFDDNEGHAGSGEHVKASVQLFMVIAHLFWVTTKAISMLLLKV